MDDLERIKRELERQKRDRLKELAQRAELERRTDPPGTLMGFDRATGKPLVAQSGGIRPMNALSNIGTVGDVGRAAGGGFDVGNRRSAEGNRRRSPVEYPKQLIVICDVNGVQRLWVRDKRDSLLLCQIGSAGNPNSIFSTSITSTGPNITDFVVLVQAGIGEIYRWDGERKVKFSGGVLTDGQLLLTKMGFWKQSKVFSHPYKVAQGLQQLQPPDANTGRYIGTRYVLEDPDLNGQRILPYQSNSANSANLGNSINATVEINRTWTRAAHQDIYGDNLFIPGSGTYSLHYDEDEINTENQHVESYCVYFVDGADWTGAPHVDVCSYATAYLNYHQPAAMLPGSDNYNTAGIDWVSLPYGMRYYLGADNLNGVIVTTVNVEKHSQANETGAQTGTLLAAYFGATNQVINGTNETASSNYTITQTDDNTPNLNYTTTHNRNEVLSENGDALTQIYTDQNGAIAAHQESAPQGARYLYARSNELFGQPQRVRLLFDSTQAKYQIVLDGTDFAEVPAQKACEIRQFGSLYASKAYIGKNKLTPAEIDSVDVESGPLSFASAQTRTIQMAHIPGSEGSVTVENPVNIDSAVVPVPQSFKVLAFDIGRRPVSITAPDGYDGGDGGGGGGGGS